MRVKPVLFVTNHVPPDRVGAFAALHEREDVEFALFGGRVAPRDAARRRATLPFPHRHVDAARRSARSPRAGDYRAVVAGDRRARRAARRLAGARRARRAVRPVERALGAAAHARPTSPARLPLRRIYRDADAVVAYGPHVARLRPRHGARNVSRSPRRPSTTPSGRAPAEAAPSAARAFQVLFVGRDTPEKGVARCSRPGAPRASDRREAVLAGRRRGHRAGARRPGAEVVGAPDARESAQLLRRRRRCGRTVDPHAAPSASRGGSSSTRP